MNDARWLFYPGDFEAYHALKQNFSRVEREYGWPAFWKSEGFHHRVTFRRNFYLAHPETFRVYSRDVGYVLVGEYKYPFGSEIAVPAGEVRLSIHCARVDAFPTIYVEGETIRSNEGFTVEDYASPPVPAGSCARYDSPLQDPSVWTYDERLFDPVSVTNTHGGFLYTFETELTARIQVNASPERLQGMTVYCGESEAEALAGHDCLHFFTPDEQGLCPRCAVRCVFIPGERVCLRAIHQFTDIPVRVRFACDDPLLNRIFDVAKTTFLRCSDVFFIDGIKRDQWIWAGDAYQCLFINRYLTADADIERRTLTALRPGEPVKTHINTIVDYSLLYLMGVQTHVETYGDLDFLRFIYPSVRALLALCVGQTDEHGFIVGRKQDWTYVDWAEIDKDGPVGAEQMLLFGALGAVCCLAEEMGDAVTAEDCKSRQEALLKRIDEWFWDETRGAYIDSFTSGRGHISRQTNLFALRCCVADERKRERIVQSVLLNGDIPPITTPYFRFFELDALSEMGHLDEVMDALRETWGGMLSRGAVTFWEDFDPSVTGDAQYAMYGDPFGKSLCHAWGANPIYLLSRHFIGLKWQRDVFTLAPRLERFKSLDCELPVGHQGSVSLRYDGRTLTVRAQGASGTLLAFGREISLQSGMTLTLDSAL